VFSFFKKKPSEPSVRPHMVDLHSHLLPGIDDGVKNYNEAVGILQRMSELGYQKVITTPHVMHDFYPNTPEIITKQLHFLRAKAEVAGIDIDLEAAAEYYLDEHFIQLIDESKPLLTFGDNYLLFEMSFLNEPAYMREGIFKLISAGYKPVLAHPERYVFIQNNPEILDELMERGALLQLNTISLSGYYSREAKKLAEHLIDEQKISFIGTDCHNARHLKAMEETIDLKYFDKVLNLPLLNNFL